jgi:parvulin-like peptidyl-prolyl isomerase
MALAAVLLALLGGCSGGEAAKVVAPAGDRATPAPVTDELLVRVGDGGGGVTTAEFQAVAARTPPDGPELTLEQRQEILDELVDQELLFQEAFARGLYRDPKVKRVLVQQLLRTEVLAALKTEDVPDARLLEYYEAHRDEFRIPEKAQVRRIFLRVDANRTQDEATALAADLRKQIQADPSKFKPLAEQHSDDAYKRRGGDMGYVDRVPDSPHPPELLDKVFTIDVGRVSEPFLAGGGVNLVLVSARREAVERPFEQVKGSVIRQIRSQRFDEASDAFVAALLATNPVVRPSDEALAAVPVDARTGGPDANPGRLLDEPELEEAP